ncbi:MAG: hypothetical protein CL927_18145 [Deltaproteobacteria bacterium]|nr:hypothetical protein [Deltaproteobacteria bacterium]
MPNPEPQAWRRWLLEGVLLTVAGLGAAILADRWFGAFHLGGAWTSSDFQDYCAGLHSMWTESDAFPAKRARLAGVLAAWSGTTDVLSALQRGAWLGSLGVFTGLALWARSLGGRWAVPVALVLAMSVAPVVLQSRMYTFYPAMNAALVLGSGLVSLAMVRPSNATLLWAGVAVGLALCIDVRGLLWAGSWLVGLLAAMALRREQRWLPWCALLLPIALSYGLGAWSFPADALSLEQQLDVRPLAEYRSGGEEARSAWRYSSRFVWGQSAPWAVLGTLGFLWTNQRSASDTLGALTDFAPIVEVQLDPWLAPLFLGLGLAVVVLRRQPAQLGALVVTVLPFGMALWVARSSIELQLRFLSQALAVVPLVLGVAVGAALSRWADRRVHAVGFVVLVVALLSVFGTIPGPLSPAADWRRTWPPNRLDYLRTTRHNAYTHLRPEFRTCRVALGLPVLDESLGPAPQKLRGESFKPISPALSEP